MLSLASASLSFNAAMPAARPALASTQVSMMAKSQSLPFMENPAALDGSMAGDVGFDPLGFSSAFPNALLWMRECEIKHGRSAMLGVVGWIAVDTGLKFPFAADIKSYQATYENSPAIWGLIFAVGLFEIAAAGKYAQTMKGMSVPGDFAFTGGFGKDPKQMERLKLAEIKHCRLAMLAFSGIVTQAQYVHDFPYMY